MKRLSVNRIAAAGLRADQRGYRAMAAGIFLSIFFIATLCQCAWGVYVAAVQGVRARMGQADAFYFDADEYSDADIMDEGSFDRLGHIAMTAQAGGLYIGSYDETAASIMDRRYASGRAPEKAGEMAAEKSFLDHLSIAAEIGESFELTVTPIDGLSETRTYTLTGVLAEQTSRFDWDSVAYFSETRFCTLPSALVSQEEAPFASGRVVTQRVMTLKRGVSLEKALARNFDEDGHLTAPLLIGLTDFGRLTVSGGFFSWNDGFSDEEVTTLFTMLALLGGSLLLACCVGIAGAMEGQLARKTKEIGMLRAVGATRRQIRRIFGREAWLVALVMAPVSLACACLAVWGMSRAFPSLIAFDIQPVILVPIALMSVACIVISAFVPLRRASRVMPMGVLRDTHLLRRIGRVKSRDRYHPARLIAWRQNRLHPLRPLGAGALTGLMLVCMLSALSLFSQMSDQVIRSNAAFSAYFYMDYATTNSYYTMLPDRALSAGDIAQIEALPGVKKARERSAANVCWITDSAPSYLTNADLYTYSYLLSEEELLRRAHTQDDAQLYDYLDTSDEGMIEIRREAAETNERVRRETGAEAGEALVPLGLMVLDDEALRSYASDVAEGAIDLDAINRGEQVLLCAPDRYVRIETKNGKVIGARMSNKPFQGATLIAHNDGDFSAGETLELMLLTGPEADFTAQSAEGFYAGLEERRAAVTIGAVLNNTTSLYGMDSAVTLFTTRRGLNAMGFSMDRVDSLDIYTEGAMSAEEEQALSESVESILRRADNMSFYDELQTARAARQQNAMVMTALLSVALLFFAVAVSMITGSVTRRIRSDARMIGTLRAVGADAKTVVGCYRMQILLSIALGLLVGLACMIALLTSYYGRVWWMRIAAPACVLGFSALCYAACMLALRSRIRETISRSIVENIREM
ncbi:MAG: FtsX-like permease family protein [Clostridiales bacterium]|nr:FtsX-like permease family protein [Clostridiales bacterium]